MFPSFEDQYTLVGDVVGAHGLEGYVIIAPKVDMPSLFDDFDLFWIDTDGQALKPARILSARMEEKAGRRTFFVHFDTIVNRTDAEQLKGARIYQESQYIEAAMEEDPYELFIDLTVEDDSGNEVGYVTDVIQNPAHPILVIQKDSGQIMVPAVDEYVLEINTDKSLVIMQNLDAFSSD